MAGEAPESNDIPNLNHKGVVYATKHEPKIYINRVDA